MQNKLTISIPEMTREIVIAEEWVKKRDELIAQVDDLDTVESQADFEQWTEWSRKASKLSSGLEKQRLAFAAPFLAAQKLIKATADKARASLEDLRTNRVKPVLNAYVSAQRKAAEEERIRLEKARQEEIARQMAEHAEEIEEAEELGIEISDEELGIEDAPVKATIMAPVSDDSKILEVVKWDVENESEIPQAFFAFDPRKVNAYRRDHTAEIKERLKKDENAEIIPGIKFRLEIDTRSM